jgi:HSP20 family protein
MALVPWDPIRNLISLQDRMNRLFDETMHRGRGMEPMDMGTWAPPVDIYETEAEIVLVAEVPGVDEKDVDVEVKDNLLTIKGERRMEKSVKEESYHRVERAYGGFSRSFTLPQAVDSEKITATYNRGVLEIRLPKPEKAKTHQIKIESRD